MQSPPFKLAPHRDMIGDSGMKTPLPVSGVCVAVAVPRRMRLADLPPLMHCSVIGTCLSTAELRKLVPRFYEMDRQRTTDLEIHHAAVQLSNEGGAAAKALQKLLDARYENTLKRFKPASDEAALHRLWREALDSGDIPGAYWALMTHPQTTDALQKAAFGDVHMLSHLVGAANRADIRRLVALEAECSELKEKVERQQLRLHELGAQRDAAILKSNEQEAQLAAQLARQTPLPRADLAGEVKRLRVALEEREQRLALFAERRREAEQREFQQHRKAREVQDSLAQMKQIAEGANAERQAVEEALARTFDHDPGQGALQTLKGKHILYVGGRPNSNAALSRLVKSVGGELTLHDGGVEDRKGILEAILPRAHMVLFPVDCIGHDAMNTLKRVCTRQGIAYHPLRTASVASFVELVSRLATEESSRRSLATG